MADNNEKNDIFAQSLKSLTADDIKQKQRKKFDIVCFFADNIRYAVMFLCVCLFAYSAYMVADALVGYAEQEKIYNDVEDIVLNGNYSVEIMLPSSPSPATPDYDASQKLSKEDYDSIVNTPQINKEYETIKIKLMNLKERYPDLYGWITVPGTVINYPIMQTDNNDYYLDHSYSGTSLAAGSIFADYRCQEKAMDNKNLVIYGHHMTSNSMFHPLDEYLKASFFESTNIIKIYTLDGMYTYQVFSVYETTMYDPYITTYFYDDAQYNDFVMGLKEKSIHNNDNFDLSNITNIVTLSTCNNRYESGRLAVHGVLIEKYESN